MAKLLTTFDATQISPEASLGNLPVGTHSVIIVDSDVKPTKAGDNKLVEFELKIISGEHEGVSGAYRLNLYHASQVARDIAQRDFSRLCHAVGVLKVEDTGQLHNIPFLVEVGLQKGDNKMTEVKKVMKAGSAPATQAPAAQHTGWQTQAPATPSETAAPATAAGKQAPW